MKSIMKSGKERTSERLSLWNPQKAANIGFFILPAVGIFIHAMNWRRLYVKRRELTNWLWLVGYVVAISGSVLLKVLDCLCYYDIPIVMVSMTYAVLWEKVEGNKQIEYVQKAGHEFDRNLFWPFFIGVLMAFIMGLFINKCFGINILSQL